MCANSDNIGYELMKLTDTTNSPNIAFTFYPNPAVNNCYLDIALDKQSEIGIKLVDILGREVYSNMPIRYEKGLLTIEIGLSKCSSGIYLCYVYDDKGTKLFTEKLVILK